jgi:hypothetical protein
MVAGLILPCFRISTTAWSKTLFDFEFKPQDKIVTLGLNLAPVLLVTALS